MPCKLTRVNATIRGDAGAGYWIAPDYQLADGSLDVQLSKAGFLPGAEIAIVRLDDLEKLIALAGEKAVA